MVTNPNGTRIYFWLEALPSHPPRPFFGRSRAYRASQWSNNIIHADCGITGSHVARRFNDDLTQRVSHFSTQSAAFVCRRISSDYSSYANLSQMPIDFVFCEVYLVRELVLFVCVCVCVCANERRIFHEKQKYIDHFVGLPFCHFLGKTLFVYFVSTKNSSKKDLAMKFNKLLHCL